MIKFLVLMLFLIGISLVGVGLIASYGGQYFAIAAIILGISFIDDSIKFYDKYNKLCK